MKYVTTYHDEKLSYTQELFGTRLKNGKAVKIVKTTTTFDNGDVAVTYEHYHGGRANRYYRVTFANGVYHEVAIH